MVDEALVVVLADLAPSFAGEPSPLVAPFGACASLLRATIERVIAAALAPVAVSYRDTPRNHAIPEMLAGLDVRFLRSAPGTNDAAALEAAGAGDTIVVDARHPFVSPSVLRAQLAVHREKTSEMTFASMAAHGLAGVVIRRDCFARLTRALSQGLLSVDVTFFEFCASVRDTFECAEAQVPPAFVCMPITLCCDSIEDAERLSAFAITDEDYERVFDAECRAAWPAPSRRTPRAAKRKILFTAFITSTEPGATVALEILLDHWNAEKCDVVIALPNRGQLYQNYARKLDVRMLPVRWISHVSDGRWMGDVIACAKLLEEEQPDLVYVNGTVAPMVVACRERGIPCIAHLHLPILTVAPALAGVLARRACVPLYDAIITPARTSADRLNAAFRPPPGRVTTVECGISTAHFDPARHDRRKAREKLGVSPEARVISTVGMFVALKQPHLAIETLAKLVAEFPTAVLLFAGFERLLTGHQQRLEQLAVDRGLVDRVKFLGHTDDVTSVYAATDVLLHCAIGDTFPLVLLEAMSMGKPVVAVADAGATEIVKDGETGRLVAPPGDPIAFAAAVREIFRDPTVAAKMATLGRARAIEHYDATLYTRRIERICDRVLAGQPIE